VTISSTQNQFFLKVWENTRSTHTTVLRLSPQTRNKLDGSHLIWNSSILPKFLKLVICKVIFQIHLGIYTVISDYPNIWLSNFWNKRMNIELNQIQNKSQFHTKILRLFNCWSSISLNSQYCIKFAIFLKIIGKLECRWDGQQRVWGSCSWWT